MLKNKNIVFLYALLIALINYVISYFTSIYIVRYGFVKWHLIPSNYIVFSIILLNLLLVLLQWFFFTKLIPRKKVEYYLKYNIFSLYIFAIILALIFQIYNLEIGNIDYFDVQNIFKKWSAIVSIILLTPIIEELIYRELLVQLLYLKNKLNIFGIIFISFLFTLIHIVPNEIDFTYLANIFIAGVFLILIRIKKGLIASIVVHSLMNLIVFLFRLDIW